MSNTLSNTPYQWHRYLVVTVVLSTLLVSCSGTQIANKEALEVQAGKQATTSEVSPKQALASAKNKISLAKDAELGFFAPLHMQQAENKFQQALQLHNKSLTGKKSSENRVSVLTTAFAASRLVDQAYQNRTAVEQHLKKSLAHRKILLDLGVNDVLPERFSKGMLSLQELIKDVEGGFVEEAVQAEIKVLQNFAVLEADTLKIQHLSKARNQFKQAETIDAKDYARVSYQRAKASMEYAEQFIEQNYRDRAGVVDVSSKAFHDAAHAYQVALEAQKIVDMNEKQAEQYVLHIESLLQSMNKNKRIKHLTSMSIQEQVTALINQSSISYDNPISEPSISEIEDAPPLENKNIAREVIDERPVAEAVIVE